MELQKALPGEDAQYRMAPLHRKNLVEEALKAGQYRPSAVMLLFCLNSNNEVFIPLIERMAYNGVHSAQISLPGGKFEQGDDNLQNTAIRECFEEIGIKDIEVIGQLTQLYIPVSNFLVQPFIGVCKIKDPVMVNQEREVKSILRLKIDTLLDSGTVKAGSIAMPGNLNIKAPYFELEDNKIWGATAMILSELKEILASIF